MLSTPSFFLRGENERTELTDGNMGLVLAHWKYVITSSIVIRLPKESTKKDRYRSGFGGTQNCIGSLDGFY